AVAAQHAGLAHFEEVHPIPLRPVEARAGGTIRSRLEAPRRGRRWGSRAGPRDPAASPLASDTGRAFGDWDRPSSGAFAGPEWGYEGRASDVHSDHAAIL